MTFIILAVLATIWVAADLLIAHLGRRHFDERRNHGED